MSHFVVLVALWLGAVVHPNSVSSSRVSVRGSALVLEIQCQSAALIECIDLDRDGDARLDEVELERGRAAISEYLLAHYTFDPAPSAPSVRTLELVPGGPFDEQRLQARFEARFASTPERLALRCRLFLERNPFHRDSATVLWNDDPPATFLFAEGVDLWEFAPASVRRGSVFIDFTKLGIEHILTGYDHIAFLLALIVAARRLRSLVGVVSAFTVAHSITLAAAALGWFDLPGRAVELAIALSIAYVGAENLLFRRPASRWFEAFGFGLVHGLGFAGFLGDSLLFEPLKTTALLGFNLGVECGQLAIVLTLALCLRWVPGDRALEGQPRAWFAPRWLRLGASAVIAILGFYWFAERAGWLP
ncbi:MAG: HupE/UreJ family protein [Planctomycetes bacterium]|nr:HupE/UreJ family protein [Planctomycetota bacterium]